MMETAKDLVQFSARDHLVLVWMDGLDGAGVGAGA